MLRNTKRYLVYGGLFVMMLISYVDRINLSVAAGPISRAYGLDTIAMGYLLSAYLWTYLIFLIPSAPPSTAGAPVRSPPEAWRCGRAAVC